MYTLSQIASIVSGRLEGDGDIVIRGVAPVSHAGPGTITFASDGKSLQQAAACEAAAVVVSYEAPPIDKPVLRTANPRLVFARVMELFAPDPELPASVSPSAFVADDARLGEGVAVGAGAHVGSRTVIGDNAVLYPGVYVGADVVIGDGTVLYPGVVVLDRVQVGCRVVLHPGAVLGSDGFGYVPEGGRHRKVPQIGTVVVEDDVEIGVNSAVARATMGATRIGRGTKIDGHVYVAHNVQLGADVIIAGMSALAGSAVVEDGVTLAGQTGIVGHLTVGKGTTVAARGLVIGDVPPGSFVSGNPARPHGESLRIAAAQRRVPDLIKTISRLERRLADLEAKAKDGADAP